MLVGVASLPTSFSPSGTQAFYSSRNRQNCVYFCNTVYDKTSFMNRYNNICTGPPCTLASSKHMRILTLAKRQISFVLQTTKMHFSQLKCNKFGNTYIIDYSNNIFLHPSFFVSENQQDHFLLIVLNVSETCFVYKNLLF